MSVSRELYLGSGIELLPLPKTYKRDPKQWSQGSIYRLCGNIGFKVENGFVADAIEMLELTRMDDIRQLQFLTGVIVGSDASDISGSHCFSHTRMAHVLRAAVLHLQIMEGAGIEDRETVILGVWAELMHDMFLCAGGDSWKAFAQIHLFDEDDGFAQKLWQHHRDGWIKLCKQHGLDPVSSASRVEDIVHGKGLSGSLHEIVDTGSYLLGDTEAIRKFAQRTGLRSFDDILKFADSHPWNVWAHISLRPDQAKAVVCDLDKLGNFIQLRALLWRWLYNLPETKFIELILRNIVYPHMLETRAFRRFSLLQKGDRWLLGRLKQRVDLNSLDRVDLFGAAPQVQCFGGQQEAQSFEVEMAEHAALTLLVGPKDFQRTSSKLGTYYVLGPGGALGTFQEFGRAAQVAEILDLVAHANISSWYVFWVQNPTLSEQMSKAWRAARLRWK